MGMLDRRCDHEAEWQESSGQWHFVGPSAKFPNLSTRKCYGPVGGGLTNISSYMETAILNGAINILHNLVLLANHCLSLVMVSNASSMRRSGVVLCSVDGIRKL